MSEMIERVARAIVDGHTRGNVTFDELPEHHRVLYRDAANEAMDVIAEWLETQRADLPAHGWEFATALKES